ncbi:MAG: glucose 1-dehydrogenase [Hyphomicrobiales bacterium]|nr:MAG: glucose 1-dehydrogenase [Hyphomicrobiales bacterium]
MSLQGKVAIVTGAAAGIGAACARKLAAAGASIVATDLDRARGESLVASLEAMGTKATFIQHDVCDEAAWPTVTAAAMERFGRLDIMVANAGIAIAGPIETMRLEDWRKQQAVNVDGVFLSVRHAIAPMRASGGGSIIIMSSVAGLRGAAGLAGYSATKAAVRYFAKSAAMELVADGIRVNSVHPGVIDTEIWDKMSEAQREKGVNMRIDPHERVKAIVPAGVIGTPDEIAEGVLFLASDASRYMTGAEIVIDGGMTAGAAPRR